MTRFVTSQALGNAPRRLLLLIISSIAFAAALAAASSASARSIYLNGVDISNARNQSLEGVDIRIDAEGNVFIIGNHYEIYQQQPVAPLVPKAESPGSPHQSRATPKRPSGTIDGPAGRPPQFKSGAASAKAQLRARPLKARPPVADRSSPAQGGENAGAAGKRPL